MALIIKLIEQFNIAVFKTTGNFLLVNVTSKDMSSV